MRCTEVYFSDKELDKLVKKLKKMNFEILSNCKWSQVWTNPASGEQVVLVRG